MNIEYKVGEAVKWEAGSASVTGEIIGVEECGFYIRWASGHEGFTPSMSLAAWEKSYPGIKKLLLSENLKPTATFMGPGGEQEIVNLPLPPEESVTVSRADLAAVIEEIGTAERDCQDFRSVIGQILGLRNALGFDPIPFPSPEGSQRDSE